MGAGSYHKDKKKAKSARKGMFGKMMKGMKGKGKKGKGKKAFM